jgi:hypothetical protein
MAQTIVLVRKLTKKVAISEVHVAFEQTVNKSRQGERISVSQHKT